MIIFAVIVGYLLGVAPFLYKEIKNIFDNSSSDKKVDFAKSNAGAILDEWLNGAPKTNQEDLFNEYMTGQESRGEER